MPDQTLAEILSMAIRREEEAFFFYRDLEGRVPEAAAKEAIGWVAAEELKHRDFLVRYRDGRSGAGSMRLTQPVAYHIAEHQQEPESVADLSRKDVFLVAAHRELRSHRFYSSLADMHPEGETREVLRRMASEELSHKEKMEYLYTNAAFPQTDGG
jgi:rubrerythrin